MNTTDQCDACHNYLQWNPIVFVDHNPVFGVCSSCHNNETATGKPSTHIITDLECDQCHTPANWTGNLTPGASGADNSSNSTGTTDNTGTGTTGNTSTGTTTDTGTANNTTTGNTGDTPSANSDGGFDHTTAVGTCASCHNAVDASGKPTGHMSTTDDCGSCHTYEQWLPVAAVDHTQVFGTCSNCHDGVIATGMSTQHINTSRECDVCHTVDQWLGSGGGV
jgi:hypothetical protein